MWPIFAMDTCFYNSQGSYSLDARCEMLRELGYDGTYLTLWDDASLEDLSRLGDAARAHDLAVAGVWSTLDVAAGEAGANRLAFASAPRLGGLTRLELGIRDSRSADRRYDASEDDEARALIERLLALLPDDVEICLYPHVNFWLERFEDAIELCDRVDDERLGLCFPAYHWYAVRGDPVEPLLAKAGSRLRSVNVCGSRRLADPAMPTIESLADGELDNFALLGSLQRVGYRGMVGVQGYGMGGDCYGNLQRSLTAYRDLTRRLAAHPEWAVLRPA
jgi:sugar phosphate isomerase/epimerase